MCCGGARWESVEVESAHGIHCREGYAEKKERPRTRYFTEGAHQVLNVSSLQSNETVNLLNGCQRLAEMMLKEWGLRRSIRCQKDKGNWGVSC